MIGEDPMETKSGKEKRFLSPTDAAIFLSLSKPTLDRLVRRKEIPSYKIGGRRLFDREELIEWVKSHRDPGPSAMGFKDKPYSASPPSVPIKHDEGRF
jgi:excisionase family DNA binding protein